MPLAVHKPPALEQVTLPEPLSQAHIHARECPEKDDDAGLVPEASGAGAWVPATQGSLWMTLS